VASVNQSLSFEKKKKNPESGTLTRERLAFMFPVSGLLAACLLHVLFSFCPVYAVALPLLSRRRQLAAPKGNVCFFFLIITSRWICDGICLFVILLLEAFVGEEANPTKGGEMW